MMTLSRVRKLLIAAPLLAVVAAWALPSTEAGVTAPAGCAEIALAAGNTTYYNNAAHSMVVGQFGKDCCNNNVAWGQKTKFSVVGGCFPCFPPPQ